MRFNFLFRLNGGAEVELPLSLGPEVRRVFEENWRVYGIRKVWRQLVREDFDVARCTVARLMKDMGIQGIIRGKPHRTTIWFKIRKVTGSHSLWEDLEAASPMNSFDHSGNVALFDPQRNLFIAFTG